MNSKDREATDRYFQDAVRNHPDFYWAYRAKLENMMPKWGGDWKSMYQFAVDTARNAPAGTLLPHIYAYALEEIARRSPDEKKFLNDPKVWSMLEKIYNQLIADYPASTTWRVRFARVAMNAGKEALALKHLEAAEIENPRDYRVMELKAKYAERHRQWPEEEEYGRSLIRTCPSYFRAYGFLGYALIQQRRYQEAIGSFTKAIALAPQNSYYRAARCHCFVNTRRYRDAIADCTKAIELKRNYSYALRLRSEAYEKVGDAKAARQDRETCKAKAK